MAARIGKVAHLPRSRSLRLVRCIHRSRENQSRAGGADRSTGSRAIAESSPAERQHDSELNLAVLHGDILKSEIHGDAARPVIQAEPTTDHETRTAFVRQTGIIVG